MRAALSARGGSFRLWGHLRGLPRRQLCLVLFVMVVAFKPSASDEGLSTELEKKTEWSSRTEALESTHIPAGASLSRSFFRYFLDPLSLASSFSEISTRKDKYWQAYTAKGPQLSAESTGSSSRALTFMQAYPNGALQKTPAKSPEGPEARREEASVSTFVPRLLQDIPSPRRPRNVDSVSRTTNNTRQTSATQTRQPTVPTTTTKREVTTTTTKSTTTLPPLQGWKEVEEGPLEAMKNEPDLTLLTKAMESNPLTKGDSIITRLAITLFAPTDEALSKLDVKMDDLAKMNWMPRKEWVEEMIVMTHLVAPRLIDPREITTEESVFQTRSNQVLKIYRAGPPDPKPPADNGNENNSKTEKNGEQEAHQASRSSSSGDRPKLRSGPSSRGDGDREGSGSAASSRRTGRTRSALGSEITALEEGENATASGIDRHRSPRRRTAENAQEAENDREDEKKAEEHPETENRSDRRKWRRTSGDPRKRRESEEEEEEEEADAAADSLEEEAERGRTTKQHSQDVDSDEYSDREPTHESDDDEADREEKPRRSTSANSQRRGRSSSPRSRSTQRISEDTPETEDEEEEDYEEEDYEEREVRTSTRRPQRQRGRSSSSPPATAQEGEAADGDIVEGDLSEDEFGEEEDDRNNRYNANSDVKEEKDEVENRRDKGNQEDDEEVQGEMRKNDESEEEEEWEEEQEKKWQRNEHSDTEAEAEEEKENKNNKNGDNGDEEEENEQDNRDRPATPTQIDRRAREEAGESEDQDYHLEAIMQDDDEANDPTEQGEERQNHGLDSETQSTASTTIGPQDSRSRSWRTKRQEETSTTLLGDEERIGGGHSTAPDYRFSRRTTVLSAAPREEEERGDDSIDEAFTEGDDERRNADSQWRTRPSLGRSRTAGWHSRSSPPYIASGGEHRTRVRRDHSSRHTSEEEAGDSPTGTNGRVSGWDPRLRRREPSFEGTLQQATRQGQQAHRRFGGSFTGSRSGQYPPPERGGILSWTADRTASRDESEDEDAEWIVGGGMLRRRLSEERSTSSITYTSAPIPSLTSSKGSSFRFSTVSSFSPGLGRNGTKEETSLEPSHTQHLPEAATSMTLAARYSPSQHTSSGSSNHSSSSSISSIRSISSSSTRGRNSSSSSSTATAVTSKVTVGAQKSTEPDEDRRTTAADLRLFTITTTPTPKDQTGTTPSISSTELLRLPSRYTLPAATTTEAEAFILSLISNISTAEANTLSSSRHTENTQSSPAKPKQNGSITQATQAASRSSSALPIAIGTTLTSQPPQFHSSIRHQRRTAEDRENRFATSPKTQSSKVSTPTTPSPDTAPLWSTAARRSVGSESGNLSTTTRAKREKNTLTSPELGTSTKHPKRIEDYAIHRHATTKPHATPTLREYHDARSSSFTRPPRGGTTLTTSASRRRSATDAEEGDEDADDSSERPSTTAARTSRGSQAGRPSSSTRPPRGGTTLTTSASRRTATDAEEGDEDADNSSERPSTTAARTPRGSQAGRPSSSTRPPRGGTTLTASASRRTATDAEEGDEDAEDRSERPSTTAARTPRGSQAGRSSSSTRPPRGGTTLTASASRRSATDAEEGDEDAEDR
ncbi:hypothetical protein, conserved, partial [Eimeria maxima]